MLCDVSVQCTSVCVPDGFLMLWNGREGEKRNKTVEQETVDDANERTMTRLMFTSMSTSLSLMFTILHMDNQG